CQFGGPAQVPGAAVRVLADDADALFVARAGQVDAGGIRRELLQCGLRGFGGRRGGGFGGRLVILSTQAGNEQEQADRCQEGKAEHREVLEKSGWQECVATRGVAGTYSDIVAKNAAVVKGLGRQGPCRNRPRNHDSHRLQWRVSDESMY